MELMTRAGCCLCLQAKAVLERLLAQPGLQGFQLREVDIDTPEGSLYRHLYTHEVPVVRLRGEVIARLRVDEEALRQRLQGAAA